MIRLALFTLIAPLLLAAAGSKPTVVLLGATAKSNTVRLISAQLPMGPLAFPPQGKAYRDNAASHRLWRWIAVQAPDLVLVAGEDPGHLVEALTQAGIPARRVSKTNPLESLTPIENPRPRPEDRSPAEVIKALEPRYGHEFKEAVYIPAMALIARMRLGSLDDVRWIARPFVDGQDSLAKPTASHLAGHLLFAELAENSGDQYWLHLARKAADLAITTPMHNEMSDSVFMACPILAKVGKLTGETKYFDAAVAHFQLMAKLCRRPDGLWRHSPLNEAAWGRGNAFPALGMALTLADLPKSHPRHAELLKTFRETMTALSKQQDAQTGMWHQVVDHPESYAEFSATAMIGRAMLIGIRNGWLDAKDYAPRVDAAWRAVSARVSDDGRVMDVCESTGKQKTLQEYLDREAIWGHDPRGGGMALIFAVERMQSSPR